MCHAQLHTPIDSLGVTNLVHFLGLFGLEISWPTCGLGGQMKEAPFYTWDPRRLLLIKDRHVSQPLSVWGIQIGKAHIDHIRPYPKWARD